MSQADADKMRQSGSGNNSKSGNGSNGNNSDSSQPSGGSGGKGGSSSGDEHWVTINGNHVLLDD